MRDAVNSDGLELNCEATKKKNSEKKKTAAHSHCEKPSFFVRKVNFCETLLGHFVAVCLHFSCLFIPYHLFLLFVFILLLNKQLFVYIFSRYFSCLFTFLVGTSAVCLHFQ